MTPKVGPRIACLLVPDLPLRAFLRARPQGPQIPRDQQQEIHATAIAIASGSDGRAEIIAASPYARQQGIRPGLSIAQARSRIYELEVHPASPALEGAARQALLDIALSFSPRASPAPPPSSLLFSGEAAVYLDATGTSSLFGSEKGFASAVAARAAMLGLPGTVAIARSRNLAQRVARHTVQRAQRTQSADELPTRVLSTEQERAFLDPLSLDLFDPDDALAGKLTRLGIVRVRDLLALPRKALLHRLGPQALALVARARGEGDEDETPLPEPAHLRLEEASDPEWPIGQLEPLLFVLRGMLSRLAERLALRALACGPLELELELEGGGRDAHRIGVSAPTLDIRVLLRLLSLSLEARPPSGSVERIRLATRGQPVRRDQLDLFRPRGPDPTALDRTLAELESLCGPGRVGSPALANDHRPSCFELEPFRLSQPSRTPETEAPSAPEARGAGPPGSHVGSSKLAVRAIRPAARAEVAVARGHPEHIRSAVASGSILESAGPWRTTGRWWDDQKRFAIDHFDVLVSDGTVLRLSFDWIRREWHVDAVYD